MSNIIEAKNLFKSYYFEGGRVEVLKDVNFQIKKGEVVSIVGPSGAGKSTLLHIMGCLDGFDDGSLLINEKDVSNMTIETLSGFRNKNLGFVFQFNNLLPEFTALENIMMPLLIRRVSRRKAKEAAYSIIERFNLLDRADHKPAELSGGECQRIAVARAIVGKPDIILADEPSGSLDSVNSGILIDMLFKLGKEQGTTIIIVTHDLSISKMTERTITLVDGKIVNGASIVNP